MSLQSPIAYTSTIGGTIIDAISVTTVTYSTTVSAYDSAYTSTVSAVGSTPGTVIVATPAPYVTSTVYLDNGNQPTLQLLAEMYISVSLWAWLHPTPSFLLMV